MKISAYHGNKLIGRADLMYHSAPFDDFADPETTPNRIWLESEITEVNPKYQRQGIMSTMYAYARMLGNTVKPSHSRSDDAKAAWASWKQAGDKEHLTKMRAEGLNEMDKTQTPPGRDGGIDWTKKQIHLGPEHVIKTKDVAKHALKVLNKTMKKSHADTAKKKDVVEAFGPLPREKQQIHLGRHTVDIERMGLDNNYISFAWHDSQGQEHYEEVPVGDLGSYDDLIDRIKQEISYQERQYTDQGVAEGSDAPYWRVEQSEATGRYYVVTGYTDKSRKVWKNKLGAADFNKKENAEAKANELNQGVVEGDDPWGPQGNFAGDKPVNVGDVTMKIIQVGDTVKYLGQRAKVVGMSKDRKYSRIAIESGFGGTTKDVLTADLKQLGQGVSEVSDSTKQSYKAKAQSQVKELEPHAKKGEYKDIAQRAIDRRTKGLDRVKDVAEEQLDEKCWDTHKQVGMKKKGNRMVPNCVPKESIEEMAGKTNPDAVRRIQQLLNKKFDANLDIDGILGPLTLKSIKKFLPKSSEKQAPNPEKTTAVQGKQVKEEKCPHCGGEMVSEELINEKKDSCYYKVKSRYKVWPSAYASGALVKCRKKGAKNWGNKSEGLAEGLVGDVVVHNYTEIPIDLEPGQAQIAGWGPNDEPLYRVKGQDGKEVKTWSKRRMLTIAKEQGVAEDQLDEKWSQKYKDSINCSNPKGFSQKAHCAGEKKNEDITEGKEYYTVTGTDSVSLRRDFNMSKDRNGWYLREGATPKQKLEAFRAFGSPKLKEFNLAAFSGGTQTKGEDNVISPVGSQTRAQYKK